MRCLSKITDTQGNEFNLMQINDFSVITSTIKGYTSPTTTNIWQAGSHTPPSWMSAQGDLLCKVNTSTVAQLQENKMIDNDYLLFKYGRVIQGSDNFYGMGFYNNKNSAARLDTFGDGPSIGNQTVDCYLGIVLDDDNQRAYILACTDKYNDPSNNKFRIWALAGKYNGTDLYWETFGEVILNQSAGGSGLYGGYKGGAGSGYIGNSLLSNKKMVGYNVPTSSDESTKTESILQASATPIAGIPKIGNGHVRITLVTETTTKSFEDVAKTLDFSHIKNYKNSSQGSSTDISSVPSEYYGTDWLFVVGQVNGSQTLWDNTNKVLYANNPASYNYIDQTTYIPIQRTFVQKISYTLNMSYSSYGTYPCWVILAKIDNNQVVNVKLSSYQYEATRDIEDTINDYVDYIAVGSGQSPYAADPLISVSNIVIEGI